MRAKQTRAARSSRSDPTNTTDTGNGLKLRIARLMEHHQMPPHRTHRPAQHRLTHPTHTMSPIAMRRKQVRERYAREERRTSRVGVFLVPSRGCAEGLGVRMGVGVSRCRCDLEHGG